MNKSRHSSPLRAPGIINTGLLSPSADLSVQKTVAEESADDTDVPFTIVVTNLGPNTATTVTLSDNIPAGMTFVSATQNSGPVFVCTPPDGPTVPVTCTIASLATNETASFTFVFHITSGAAPGTFFTNVARVSEADPPDPNSENDEATAVTHTPFPPQADMGVTKLAPSNAGPDTDITYTITVMNGGPGAATNVTVSDTIPGNLTFVSFGQTGGLSCLTPAAGAGGSISCTAGSFPGGLTDTITLVAHVPPGTASGTAYDNHVTVTSDADVNDENNSGSVQTTISSANVGITKSGPAVPVPAGTNISYTITVLNSGPDPAQGVSMNDALPAGTTFVSLTQTVGPSASCATPAVGTNGTVSCSTGMLGNGQSMQFTLVVRAGGNVTSVTNTATVSPTDSFDPDASNNSSQATTTVTPVADVSVTKSGPSLAVQNTNVIYNVVVANAGPSDATSVTLTDPPPAQTTFVSVVQTGGIAFTCTASTCTAATLPAGGSASFRYTFHIVPGTTGVISNTASVTAPADTALTNNSATVTTNVLFDVPTLSPLTLALLAMTLAAVAIFVRRSS